LIRCCQETLSSLFLLCCTRSPTHATVAAVVVVASATTAHSLPLHHHRRPRHTIECWSGSRPLPLTGQRTNRWNPQTLTPLNGAVEAARAPSTGGDLAPTGLHRGLGPLHRVVRGAGGGGKKKKTMPAASQWSPASLGAPAICRTTHISIGPRGRPQGLPPLHQPHRHRPLLRHHRRHFLQAKPSLRTPVCRQI
jgi:hypothetical protein